MKLKSKYVAVKVENPNEFRIARAILELEFEKADWKSSDYGRQTFVYVYKCNDEVHAGCVASDYHSIISLQELIEWAKGGFEIEPDVKEMTVEEISKELGYEVKVVKG